MKKVAAVQPKIQSYESPHQFEYAGAAGGFIDRFGYPFCRGRILNRMEPDLGQYNQPSSLFWASGACMVVKAKLFRDAGGFDRDFWAHMEEIDLCWRLKSQGYKISYQPESVVFHLGGGTLSYNSPKKVYLNFRNNLFMLFKKPATATVSPYLFCPNGTGRGGGQSSLFWGSIFIVFGQWLKHMHLFTGTWEVLFKNVKNCFAR